MDRNKLELSDIKFSENLASFSFSYKGRNYEYNRLTHQIVEKKKEKSRSLFDRYSWMKYSPDRKYLVYVKKHNLYVKGNGEMGMDTTEVQLTTMRMMEERTKKEKSCLISVGAPIQGIFI